MRGSAWSARISIGGLAIRRAGATQPLGVLLACGALLGCGGLAEGGEQRPPLGGSPDGVPEVSSGPEVPREDLGPLPPPEASSADAPGPTGARCRTRAYTRGSVDVYDQAGLDELSSCSEVRGNLTIHPFEGADLRALGALTSVHGTLMLGSAYGQDPTPAFPSLAGLDSLQHVGSLVLRGVQADSLENLHSLRSVGGASTEDGRLQLSECPRLRDLGGLDRAEGFESVYVESCAKLGSLNGLFLASELASLSVMNTPLNRLDALNDLQEVSGALMFISTALRTAGGLDALRKANQLIFQSNQQLTDLSALNALMEVNQLIVASNPALRSLPEFSSLISLVSLSVLGNDQLQQIGQVPRLLEVESVAIQSNPVLASITALGTVRSAQRIQIDYNPNLVELDLRSLQSVSSMLHVAYNPQLDGRRITPPASPGGAVIIGGNRGDQLSLDPCPWSGDGVCVGPPNETLCAAGADSDCSR